MKNFYRDGGLVLSVIAQTVITAILAVLLYMHDLRHFWILLPFVVLVCSFTIGKLIVVTHRAFRYVNTLKGEIITADSAALYHSPTAIGIVDKNMRFIWYNPVFAQEFKELAQYDTLHGVALSAITPASTDLLLSESGSRISYGEKYYKINAGVPRENMAGEIYVIYFEDITKESILEIEKRLSHPVVMIIMIDAYEEIFSGENVSESMTASVVVQVDKLLEDYIKKTTGVLRKTGRNKFWAVVEERHINELVDSKVKLLDEARKITVTDRICVTLSFGIGRTGETMAQSEQYARQALEMALGRGGDQAAVKTESGFEFYGGFSKGIERHTNKVRTRLIANSLLDMANSADIIYVMGHKFSDLDSIGSAVGLACGLRNLGKSAYIVIDRGTSLGSGLLKRIERESEKDKDKDKSAPLFIAPEKAIDAWTEKSLLIIVDVHNKKLLESLALYELAEKVVVIDHHRKMVDFIENAAIFHHEVTASSTAEMVTELLQYFGKAGVINSTQAEALLAGIMLDTKNFSLKTGVRTFEAAAFLRKLGADTVNVKSLFAGTIENYKQKSALVAGATLYKKCAIVCTEHMDDEMRIVAPQAADELLEIEGVDASFVVYKTSPTEISISARSIGSVNVQVIMESLGGGGHHNMAGVQLKDVTIGLAERKLREAIDS